MSAAAAASLEVRAAYRVVLRAVRDTFNVDAAARAQGAAAARAEFRKGAALAPAAALAAAAEARDAAAFLRASVVQAPRGEGGRFVVRLPAAADGETLEVAAGAAPPKPRGAPGECGCGTGGCC